jgi:hypothetical protein
VHEATEAEAVIGYLPRHAAMVLATEILLADPLSLHDDVLESALYLLRERLMAPGVAGLAGQQRLSAQLQEYTDATAESLEVLGERVTRLEEKAGQSAE